jgi:hypothetical protein
MSDAVLHTLSSDLNCWQVKLTTGNLLEVRAHGVKELDDCYVFVALMEGSPAYEYELLRVPAVVVAHVAGG